MKLSIYDRLMQYPWFYKLMINFTLMEYLLFAIMIGLILWL